MAKFILEAQMGMFMDCINSIVSAKSFDIQVPGNEPKLFVLFFSQPDIVTMASAITAGSMYEIDLLFFTG